MSFDKAVIRRFNEDASCAPPPTKYDPKLLGSCAKDINFGHYSGRKDQCIMKDGFVTPGKPVRGRPKYPGSISTARSWSDTRLRKGSRSTSSKSLQEIEVLAPAAPMLSSGESLDKAEIGDFTINTEVEALKSDLLIQQGNYEIMKSVFEGEKRDLTTKITVIDQKLSEITSSYNRLDEEYSAHKVQCEQLEKESTSKIESLEMELKNREEMKKILNSEKEQLQLESEELKQKIVNLEAALAELESQITTVREQAHLALSEKEHEDELMKALRDDLENTSIKSVEMQAKYEEEKSQLVKKYEETCEIFNSEKIRLQSEGEELKHKIVQLEGVVAELESQVTASINQIQHFKSEIEEKDAHIQLLDEDLKNSNLKAADVQAKFETEKDQLLQSHDEKTGLINAEKEQLKSDFKEMQTTMEQKENFVRELQIQISEFQKQIQCGEAKCQEQESLIKSMEIELTNRQTEMTELQSLYQADKLELEGTIQNLTESLSDLSCNHNDLLVQHKNLSDELMSVRNEFENCYNSVQSLTCELSEKDETIRSLQSTIDLERANREEEIRAKEELLTELQNAKDELQQKYAELENELLRLKEKTEEDDRNIQSLNSKLDQQQEAFVEMQSIFDDAKSQLQSRIEELVRDNEKITLSCNELDEKCRAYNQKYKELNEESNLKIELLEDEMKNHEEMSGILKAEKQRLILESEELRKNIAEKENGVTNLKTQIATLESEAQAASSLKVENESRIKLLEVCLNEERTKIAELQSSHETEKTQTQETIQTFTDTIADLNCKINELVNEHNVLSSNLANAQNEAENFSKIIDTLRGELTEKEQEIQRLQATNDLERSKRAEEILASEKILTDLQAANGELQQKLVMLDEEMYHLKKQACEDADSVQSLTLKLQEQHNSYVKIQSAFEDEKKLLTSKNEKIIQELEGLKTTYQRLDDQFNAHKLQYEMLQKEATENVQKLETQCQQKDVTNASLKSQINQLQADGERTQKELHKAQGYKAKYTACKSELSNLKDEFQSATHQHKDDQETIKSLSETIQRYEQEIQERVKEESSLESLKAQLHALTLENNALRENNDKYQSLFGDYADLASHQNNKQKIKHIINLKEEVIQLRKESTFLRQQNGELKEKLRNATTVNSSNSSRRFDPSQAFKQVLKEPFIRDGRDVRGPDARGTFTVPKKTNPKPAVTLVDSKKESKQGLAFDITFTENKEN